MRMQRGAHGGRQDRDRQAVGTSQPLEEALRQQLEVAAPFTQRRQRQRHHVQAVEEVLPELAPPDRRPEVGMRGRDDPHVDAMGLLAAHAPDLATLEGPEELRLKLHGHGRDLIEEQGATVRQLEEAGLGGNGAGKGPLLMAEQLALEEGAGDRRTVDLDERPAGAWSS